ncbi:hypothetical protein X773_27155 [Mesorhizobium sp. LSJC285A00]|nr:hypothetical protein X773_27155 [Mesorhizobium sp. LSJC285A00]
MREGSPTLAMLVPSDDSSVASDRLANAKTGEWARPADRVFCGADVHSFCSAIAMAISSLSVPQPDLSEI